MDVLHQHLLRHILRQDDLTDGDADLFAALERTALVGQVVLACTAAACVALLKHYNIPIKGKRVVVIGRSLVIGKPVSLLLLAEHATVTICHSRSENLPDICREADILVVAAGKAGMVGAESVRAGQVVLDVGIHVGADGNLCGDTRFAEVEPVVEAITPVPGGVGTVTSTILASHVVEAAERAANQ